MRRKEQYADEIIERMERMKNGGWATYIDEPTKDAVIECCQNCVESWCGRHKDHVVTDVRAIKEAEQTESNLSDIPTTTEDCSMVDPLHDDCFDCDKFFTCEDKGDGYKTDCPWK